MFQPTGFSHTIFKDRYAFTETETWEEACRRIARQMAQAESPEKQKIYEEKFNSILVENQFVPGGRIWYNSGRNNPQLLNCFVLTNDLDSKQGWGNIAKELIISSMTGGGNGVDFSDVRPNGASIEGQRGTCPGPVSLMKLLNNCGPSIRAGGSRRIALMFSLDLDHPDIMEFLDAKLVKGELEFANVSVRSKRTTEFIKAVKKDADWELSWKGKYKKTIKARDLWEKIVHNTYASAEPGFLNMELAENESNISYLEPMVTTNPCTSGDTELLTREGPVRIDSLVGKLTEIWNGFEWSEVTPFITGTNQEMMLVTFSNGRSIRCTKYHKFPINFDSEKWMVQADELEVGLPLIDYSLPDETAQQNVCVVSVKPDGVDEKVYCFNEPKRHYGVFNGILTGQCGEIFLSSYDCCCLGHIVLSRFISGKEMNWHELANTIRIGVRFLDNVLSVNQYPLPEMKEKSNKLRRIGLGTTALADTLAILGFKYGSVEGNKFVDKLYRFISKIAYEASVMLAVEKGMFPGCNPKKHVDSGFMRRMPAKIKSLVEEHGIRNCAILTQAPTGTVSILSGNCSSGIEPMFAPAYERRYFDKDVRKKELVFHPLFEEFMKEGKSVEHFVGARDLSVRDHMTVQATIQNHVDNAVSKTINIPEDYPVEDVAALWLEFLPELKGTTFYRENTRGYTNKDGVREEPPLTAIPLEEAKARFKEAHTVDTTQAIECPSGVCAI